SSAIHKWLMLFFVFLTILIPGSSLALAHPLGNFTINHFTRIEVSSDCVKLHGVIDMAEIPTFQELQKIDTDGDGKASTVELDAYVSNAANQSAGGMSLIVDGVRVPLSVVAKKLSLPSGAGGLETLRIELDLVGEFSAVGAVPVRKLQFEDANYSDRIGWREIVAAPLCGTTMFNSSAFGNGISNELRSSPQDRLAAPLNERNVELSFTSGSEPAGVRPLMTRDGHPAQAPARDRLAELIAAPHLTP